MQVYHYTNRGIVGIQDLFGKGMDTDSCEAIQTVRKAKELIDKLTEYKSLAKVEELEEQNYNMIDNVLNNGVGVMNQSDHTSIKERLSQKKVEVERNHKGGNATIEKELGKKAEIEI